MSVERMDASMKTCQALHWVLEPQRLITTLSTGTHIQSQVLSLEEKAKPVGEIKMEK